MFGDYVFEKSSAQYKEKLLIRDDENLNGKTDYISAFSAHGFEIINYADDLTFRIKYEELLKVSGKKIVILAQTEQYVPFDVLRRLDVYDVSLDRLFPKLNLSSLKNMNRTELDLLSEVYPFNFDDLQKKQDTEKFLETKVYTRANVKAYLKKNVAKLIDKSKTAVQYNDWFAVAEAKSQLDVLAAKYDIDECTQEISRLFQHYILEYFGKLSQSIDRKSPVLASKALDYMHTYSDKFIVIVMDGMSEFDWNIISNSFVDLRYEKASMFAMVPSTTSVSRQCLLSGKYPSQLLEPWKQSKEKTEFIEGAKKLGYTNAQIGYDRGYNAQFNSFVRCGAVIINDVDDIVHAQHQGRLGMFNDITVLAKQKKLANMVRGFINLGYDVYITADHGNTACVGMGKMMGTGVELETKSRKFIVLRDFADKEKQQEKYKFVEFPKYYLPKEYVYLVCDVGESLDAKGEEVMTHGGLSIDEMVVPFITIRKAENNG